MPKSQIHPNQPVVIDRNGDARFKENAIVRMLLDHGGFDMNKLALMRFDQEDREQFAQLIGYSVSGFSELSYASTQKCEQAFDDLKALQTTKKPTK